MSNNKLLRELIEMIPTEQQKSGNLKNGRTYDQYYIFKLKDAKARAAKNV